MKSNAKLIRVLVIEGGVGRQGELLGLLQADRDFEIVAAISSGPAALKTVASLKPNIIVMELAQLLPDGVSLARCIMQETPTPIVIVTSRTFTDDPRVITAVTEAGVLALMEKPASDALSKPAEELLRTIKSMSAVKVIRRWDAERLKLSTFAPRPCVVAPAPGFQVVAIGASTGGPQALQEILTRLPASFPLPILVVQHIAPGFVDSLIAWLRPLCHLPIQLAGAHMVLSVPGIYVAPTDHHLVVHGRTLVLTKDPLVSGHRPAATVLFRSIAAAYGTTAIGVLLTGMGDDGAGGLSSIKQAGGATIAQNESSSVVFGMPAAAISLGVVDYVLAPQEIAALLVKLALPSREI
ncbi:MAG: chemotaxis response regulator protein-glutamate methylesterase [Herpetosiphonaceae bacterium]|nr:chemotaxis response regulator protein-glutamate methylesterase [Herpetosiphonaceae bacterium]